MLAIIGGSFLAVLHPFNLLIMVIGMVLGIAIGALPGLTATMGVALLLPFTFGMDSTTAMLLLLAIYCGGIYGGSVTAILIKTPGTPAAAATASDGYALARQGKARIALEMALYASVFGGIASFIALFVFSPQLAKLALRFGPPEYCTLALFGLTIIISVSQGSLIKGLITGMLGMLISTVGMDQTDGMLRFTFGSTTLMSGLSLVPTMIGLFAVSQVFSQVERVWEQLKLDAKITGGEPLSLSVVFSQVWNLVRSSIIGIVIGALPGTGSAIAAFLSVNEAKRVSKHPEQYGNGSLEAVCAAETGNNAVTGAALIPLLTLGVPGDVTTAVMLGALIMQGLIPGPMLFRTSPGVVYNIMIGFFIVQIIMLVVGKVAIRGYAKVVEISSAVLTPLVAVLCIVGSYAINNSLFDVYMVLVFGIVGYILPKYGFPVVPILIGFILGPMFEKGFRQSMIMSQDSLSIFTTRPICVFFLVLIVVFLGFAAIKEYRSRPAAKAVEE